MALPTTFKIEDYNDWYNKQFKTNIDLVFEINKIKAVLGQKVFTEIKTDKTDTNYWNALRTLIELVLNDLRVKELISKYDFVPDDIGETPTLFVNQFMKPTDSIINKMWRITKKEDSLNPIGLNDLKSRMKDLIRFAIKTDTLYQCDIIAKELDKLNSDEYKDKYKFYFDHLLRRVWLDAEMKTSTGYFAYHFYFELTIGVIVEIQIYSTISNSWRTLSHKIYEQIRDELEFQYQFNDIHTRIISIGHLLYLAECELHNLEQELKEK